MKIQFKVLFVALMLTFSLAISSYTSKVEKEDGKVSFIIKNNTSSNVRLYDSKGYYTINRGSAKRVSVDTGRKYYNGEGGKKGDFLFEVESDFDGKTIKLADYM